MVLLFGLLVSSLMRELKAEAISDPNMLCHQTEEHAWSSHYTSLCKWEIKAFTEALYDGPYKVQECIDRLASRINGQNEVASFNWST